MSESVQQKKIISFEELCPLWSESIRTGYLCDERLGTQFSRCIVGEAHGLGDSPLYTRTEFDGGCRACTQIAQALVNTQSSDSAVRLYYTKPVPEKKIEVDHEKFEKLKSEFMAHWNRFHV